MKISINPETTLKIIFLIILLIVLTYLVMKLIIFDKKINIIINTTI